VIGKELERVEWQGKTLALILRCQFDEEGINFFTAPDNPLQLGVLKHEQGVEIKPHVHRNSTRKIEDVQEVLHIEYGKVEAHFYSEGGEEVGSSILNSGDTLLIFRGGHGFKILESSKILEVKQGPYYGVEQDKELLHPK